MTPGRRNALVAGTVALAAVGAGALVGALAPRSRSGADALLSAAYPDLSGRQRQLSEWRGRVLLCNFWATWCAPCREEMPMLAELREKYAPKGAEFVGIGIDPAAKLAEFARSYQIRFPLLVADAGVANLMRVLGNGPGGLPFSVILDRSGGVAYRHLGALSRPEVEGVLVGLLR